MGLIIVFVMIACGIGLLAYVVTEDRNPVTKMTNMWTGFIVPMVIFSFIICIVWAVSYSTYLGLEKKLAVIEQYKESVELYAEKGVREFSPGQSGPSEFTDLKYNNYQTQVGEMIREMRDTIILYNETLTSKRVMKDSFFFKGLIFLPDKLKTVKMADYIK